MPLPPLVIPAIIVSAVMAAWGKMADADRAEFEAQFASAFPSLAGEIEKLAELLSRGLLTQEEFSVAKQALLRQWGGMGD